LGYDSVPYTSLENIVENNKDLYYNALRRTQLTLNTEPPDWQPWLRFFLHCLKTQKNNLTLKIDQEQSEQNSLSNETNLPILSLKVLELLKQHHRLTIAEMLELTQANRNTLKIRLRELVSDKRIQRHGKARATWYSL
jgi:Fic family protein